MGRTPVAFRLRGKPQKPKQKMLQYRRSLEDGEDLESLLDIVNGYSVDPKNAYVETNWDFYECYGVYLTFEYPEPDENFQARVRAYEKKLKVWEKWYDENQEEIEAELARREKMAQARIQKEQEKAQQRVSREIKALEKRLEKMKRKHT